MRVLKDTVATNRVDAEEDQSDVIAFLSRPGSYRPQPSSVERIETHGALVFLAGEHAYKIKRAIKYPYMDFSTLARRHDICRRELDLNRPAAPEIYIDVVPVTVERDGRLAIDGAGQPIEWAVHMRRFERDAVLDRVAERDGLSTGLLHRIADMAADYHQDRHQVGKADGAAEIAAVVDELDQALRQAKDIVPADDCKTFARRAARQMSNAARCLRLRAQHGFVRRCHGDLHLGNIVLLDGQPVPFDALEFDERLATIDVLYDLAFLLMDLLQRDMRPAANVVLNRYLQRWGVADNIYGLAAMPLFLGCRAAIRAMVLIDQSRQSSKTDVALLGCRARSYLRAALKHLAPAPPALIAVGGFSGSGKSTLAAALAPMVGAAPGALHLRSDVERKSLFGVKPTDRLGEKFYAPGVSEQVYNFLNRKARIALKAGHGVIVDAVFARAAERRAVEEIARDLDVPFTGLWLAAPEPTLMQRVGDRTGDASDATPRVVERQLQRGTGPISWQLVDAGGDEAQTLARARKSLAAKTALRPR